MMCHKQRQKPGLPNLENGNYLQLDISDNGQGIDPANLKRIFEPYFSTKDAGTGLGLPIAKKIIVDHKGSIRATASEEGGTRISISLPKNLD